MAQPVQVTRTVQREQIEQQLVLNRAKLQELTEQLDQLTEAHEAVEQQVIAAKAALEGFDLGYAQREREADVAESAKKEAEEAKKKAEKAGKS